MMKDQVKQIPGAVGFMRALRKVFAPTQAVSVIPPELILNFKPTYNEDRLATDHWLTTSDKFDASYAHAQSLGLSNGVDLKWRAHVTCWAASVGAKLAGSFVECGVNLGFHSRIICDYLDNVPTFYLMDTYKGFDEKTLSQKQIDNLKAWHQKFGTTPNWQNAMYEECYERVVRTFSDKPQVKIIRGTVPDTLQQVTADKISYLSIDMNCAMPEIAAMEYFWPKMISGAITVLDDYGWDGHDEQRHAWDAWAARNSAPLLSLPTGQGIIIKN